eukprot:130891-Pleurochrysis_carterae.AAC.1
MERTRERAMMRKGKKLVRKGAEGEKRKARRGRRPEREGRSREDVNEEEGKRGGGQRKRKYVHA